MTKKAPVNAIELVRLADSTFAEVPLSPEEQAEALTRTGINLGRLTARVQRAMDASREQAVRERLHSAQREMETQRAALQAEVSARYRRRPASEARVYLMDLRARAGHSLQGHFHKLEDLSEDDLNRLIAEIEAVLGK